MFDAYQVRPAVRGKDEGAIRLQCEQELDRYLDESVQVVYTGVDQSGKVEWANPLGWWNHRCGVYPNVARLAKMYLCIPATSAPSKRIFSIASLIISKLRASITPSNAEILLFLHEELPWFEEHVG